MSKLTSIVICALVAACSVAPSDDAVQGEASIESPLPPSETASNPAAWNLTWSDEFDGKALDASKWVVWEGDRRHDYILNGSSKDDVAVRDGALVVSGRKTPDDPEFEYSAGYISTNGTFAQTYGKVEFRLRGEFAPGLWYAVWGRPWADNPVPEIDVEFLAKNTSQAWFVNHWALPPLPADDRRAFLTLNGLDITQWHDYTVTWSPTLVEWLVDGKAYWRAEDRGVPHEPMFWTINAWVGGWAGTPSKSTQFPASFEVDWIRVYRPSTWLTDPQLRVMNPRDSMSKNETLNVAIADFDPGAHVEVREGGAVIDTLTTPPFKWKPSVAKGLHHLTFTATDGTRHADLPVDITVE